MSPSCEIRHASLNDFERIVELECACFEGDLAYSRRQLHHLVFTANSTTLVEESQGIIRGFIIVLYRTGSSIAGIETVNVDPLFRKQGVATRLLASAEEAIRRRGIQKIRLEVATTNHAAIALYKYSGFKEVEFLKNYYSFDHEGSRDAIRMLKDVR